MVASKTLFMKLNNIPKITDKRKRRLGQGHGSGRGKTAGRGTKGQKARGKISATFEGGALPLIKRLPFRRGKGRNKIFKKKPVIINVKVLNLFKKGEVVNLKSLVGKNIVDESDAKTYGVKILGDGKLDVPLVVELPVSHGAEQKIKKAGGRVERDQSHVRRGGKVGIKNE